MEDFGAAAAPGRVKSGNQRTGHGMAERVDAVAALGGDGASWDAEAFDAPSNVTGHRAAACSPRRPRWHAMPAPHPFRRRTQDDAERLALPLRRAVGHSGQRQFPWCARAPAQPPLVRTCRHVGQDCQRGRTRQPCPSEYRQDILLREGRLGSGPAHPGMGRIKASSLLAEEVDIRAHPFIRR